MDDKLNQLKQYIDFFKQGNFEGHDNRNDGLPVLGYKPGIDEHALQWAQSQLASQPYRPQAPSFFDNTTPQRIPAPQYTPPAEALNPYQGRAMELTGAENYLRKLLMGGGRSSSDRITTTGVRG